MNHPAYLHLEIELKCVGITKTKFLFIDNPI